MKSLMKKIIVSLFPLQLLRYRAYKILIKNTNSYLYLTGWMNSLEEVKPLDINGSPIPWMNYPTVKLLEEKLTKDLNLFEYGSGYSTYFYATKVKTVTSVEYDEKWFDVIQPIVPSGVKLIFKKQDVDGDYCRAIGSTDEQYDIVIDDGRDRVNCIKQSIAALSPSGVILLDDSQRDSYQEGFDFAQKNGFKALNIEGLKATGVGIDRTTIFYREGNCLKI